MLIFVLINIVASQNVYDYIRNCTEAFMKGYENPDFVFPYSTCLQPATQTAITDKVIGLFIFISSEQWAQVDIVLGQLHTILLSAAKGCDLDKFFDQVAANDSTSLFKWILRLWWNSVLLYRNCKEFPAYLSTDIYSAFHYLGECAKFVYPNS